MIPALLKALEEGGPPLQRVAAESILGLRPPGHFIEGPPPPGTEVLPALARAYRTLSSRVPSGGDAPAADKVPEEDRLRLDLVREIARLASEPDPLQPLAVEVLLKALSDPADAVRATASDGLGVLESQARTLTGPLQGILKGPHADATRAAARALVMLGSCDPLLEGLRSPRDGVRAACAEVLQVVGGDPAVVVPALMRLLHDPSPPVRALAAETLGFYAHTAEPAIPDLTRLLEEEDLQVKEAAASALEKIRKATE